MREIRFRAKRQDNGEWVNCGTLVSFISGDKVAYYIPKTPCQCQAFMDDAGNIKDMEALLYRVKPETIGQFIGDQDANGQDIYEGDIVQHGDKVYVIRYFEHYARFAGKNKRCVFAVFSFGNCTIIGNIHDSPNLMEAVK